MLLNKKGMTLVEVLVAMVLSLLISLALLQTSLIGIEHNVKNAVRDEAVGIAEKRINELRSTIWPVDTDTVLTNALVATLGTDETAIQRSIRTASVSFTPTRIITDVNTAKDTKQVTITVSWTWKGTTYTHSATTVLRKPS